MIFMTEKEWKMVSELLVNGDVKGLVRELSWRTYDVDEETMKQIQQLVEKNKTKTVCKDTVASVSYVAILADDLEKQKHLIAWRFLHKVSHIMEINTMWCGNWKEARLLAVEAFKVAGYDPSKYDFDVIDKTAYGFIRVVVKVKEPDIPEGYTLADGRIVDKK